MENLVLVILESHNGTHCFKKQSMWLHVYTVPWWPHDMILAAPICGWAAWWTQVAGVSPSLWMFRPLPLLLVAFSIFLLSAEVFFNILLVYPLLWSNLFANQLYINLRGCMLLMRYLDCVHNLAMFRNHDGIFLIWWIFKFFRINQYHKCREDKLMRTGICAWERNYVCLAIWILYRMSVLGGLHGWIDCIWPYLKQKKSKLY